MAEEKKNYRGHPLMEQVEQARAAEAKKQEAKYRKFLFDLEHVLKTKEGRAFVHGLLERGKAFDRSFVADERAHCYRDGQAAEAMFLFNALTTHNQTAYLQMVSENKEIK